MTHCFQPRPVHLLETAYCAARVHLSVAVNVRSLSVVADLAMVSLELFQEQFSRLKEFEGAKDQLIEVSSLDDSSIFVGCADKAPLPYRA